MSESGVANSCVPLGALKLGCRNCRVGDRQRHPQIGMVYCASCPVTLRRMAKGHSLDEATGDWRWKEALRV